MQYQEMLQMRKQKGIEIAQTKKIVRSGDKWIVPSQTSNKKYEVTLYLDKKVCTCPDYQERGIRCKHIFAVEITISREFDSKGNVRIIQTKRITYSQDWPNYDKAQTQQKELFMKLLSDLCKTIPLEPKQIGKGRPKVPMQEMVFDSALKVFTTFSLRRFMTDIKTAKESGYIEKIPHFSLVSKYMLKGELTPILKELIALSSLPLKSVETKFAVDSSGFRTTRFTEYCRVKYRGLQEHDWIKAHICCGVKTNIITAVEIAGGYSADTNKFISLVAETHDNGFDMQEVSADKAYSSRNNLAFVNAIEGVPFIPFKTSTTGKRRGDGGHIWHKMYDYFVFNREDFMKHYHSRSNVESTFYMLKTKFTDYIRSKGKTAQTNELLLKVLCHNICVLISEMFELGIEPNFLGV